MAFLLAVLLTDIPFMLGVMLFEDKRLIGRFSRKDVVLYREQIPWRTFAFVLVGALVAVCVLAIPVTPISTVLTDMLSSRLPEWWFLEEPTQYEAYAESVRTVAFALQLAVTGVVLSWIEELYFRGYLLPMMSRYRQWAPHLGGLFFALYHV